MFWIGFIAGMFALAVLAVVYFIFCCAVTHTTVEDFNNLVEANTAALINRESRIEVHHDGECLFEATFEER